MKKLSFLIVILALFISCNNAPQKNIEDAHSSKSEEIQMENISEKTFDELFKTIDAMDISENVFKIFGKDFVVITSGTEADYNSMTAGWGGWGILFEEPTTWIFLRASRYTLEYIKKNKTYTMTSFDEQYRDQVMYFGSSSGRNNDKMKNHKLTAVSTPLGNIAYKEARMIVECELTEITTVSPDDFYSEKSRNFVVEGFNDAKDYHKMVFGRISNIWVRK